jgi:hypothetical protein
MKAMRTVLLLVAAIGIMPGEAAAQVEHDFFPGLIAGRAAAPSVPRFATTIGALCIVLPEELSRAGRDAVVGVTEGTLDPAQLAAALAAGGDREAAHALSQSLVGVFTAPRRGQRAEAIRHFNDLVRGSSAEFLSNPPQEFLAVHEIVRYLSTGAPAASTWVCPAEEVVIPPPVETPLEICVMIDDDLRIITATFRPETGDTLIDGVPFREAHTGVAPDYAGAAPWFAQSDSLRFGEQLYVRFGLTRRLLPTNLRRVGYQAGTAVFAEVGELSPYPALYVPVRPGCVFQPYQRRETIRPRG